MRKTRDHALAYITQGYAVLPLRAGHKAPISAHVPRGYLDATTDLVTGLRWWTATPNAGIGIACRQSGIVTLDIDPRHGGDDTLWQLEQSLGPLPATVEAHTGGGGSHLLFRSPDVSLAGSAGPGVDVKDHGYIVAPPTVHPSGRAYEWAADQAPGEIPLAELPAEWLARLHVQERPTTSPSNTDDPLLRVPARRYVEVLARRKADSRGWAQCPFHKGGKERTPSLKVDGNLWACYACAPMLGKRVQGGNIYDFAGLLAGYALPLRGTDWIDIQAQLRRLYESG